MWPNPQFPSNLVTFTEEIHNIKLHLLCSGYYYVQTFRMSGGFINFTDIKDTLKGNFW